MPALITHDLFGRDIIDAHAAVIGHTQDDLDAFLLGNQGPDPLFYLTVLPAFKEYRHLGNTMHGQKTPLLLKAFADAVDALDEQDKSIGRSYAHGFLCHYALDSTMHPFVYAQQYAFCDAGVDGLSRKDGNEVHALIESDLDEMVLYVKTGETVATFQPWIRILRASNRTLDIVSRMYVAVVRRVYHKEAPKNLFVRAVRSFRRMQHALYSPYNGKSNVLGKIERLVRPHSFYAAMSHRALEHTTSSFDNHAHRLWKNPFTDASSTDGFWDLYAKAQEHAAELIQAFDADGFNEAEAARITHGVNFSGKPLAPAQPKNPA